MRKDQSLRFCHCIDSLSLFANKKLKMFNDMFDTNTNFLNKRCRHEVLNALFSEHREIIDEYVNSNEEDLLESYLAEIKNWKNAISDNFFVAEVNDDYAILANMDHVFKVVGITQKISEVCPKAPTWVNVTLLTFEGVITYAMSFSLYNIDYGSGAIKMFEKEVKKVLSQKPIEYAEDFLELAPEINLNIQKRNERTLVEDNLFDEKSPNKMKISYVKPGKGKHESPLKGLSEKERQKEVDAHLGKDVKDKVMELAKNNFLEMANDFAIKHSPISSFDKFINSCPDVNISWKEHKVEKLIDILNLTLSLKNDFSYRLIEMLENNNWTYTLNLEKDNYSFLNENLLSPYGALFKHNNKFTWVIFEEFRDAIKNANWDAVKIANEVNRALINTCNKLVEMCGIVELSAVYEQNRTWYSQFDMYKDELQFFQQIKVLSDICDNECLFEISEADETDKTLLINKDIFEAFGLYDDVDENSIEFEQMVQDFNEEIEELFTDQCRYKFSLFPEKLRDTYVMDYYFSIPEIQEFREFFDERVPDGKDDYQYAELITENFIYSQRNNEIRASNISDFIEDNKLDLNEEEFKEFLSRFTNAVNAIFRWDTYGHSPAELMNDKSLIYSEGEYMAKLSKWNFNIAEDKSTKKVGRNDPCPCGSGKKYKKCCGKNF